MQTHNDMQHDLRDAMEKQSAFMEKLMGRAADGMKSGNAAITAGSPGEETLAQWTAENGMQVVHRPDDPQGILRISIGGGPGTPVRLDYCTIRGKVGECIKQLEMAIEALRECPE